MTSTSENDNQGWSGYTCPECSSQVTVKVNGICWCPECRWTGKLAECEAGQ